MSSLCAVHSVPHGLNAHWGLSLYVGGVILSFVSCSAGKHLLWGPAAISHWYPWIEFSSSCHRNCYRLNVLCSKGLFINYYSEKEASCIFPLVTECRIGWLFGKTGETIFVCFSPMIYSSNDGDVMALVFTGVMRVFRETTQNCFHYWIIFGWFTWLSD